MQMIYLTLVTLQVNLEGIQGLRCLSCDAAVSPIDCDTVRLCGPHEICFTEVSVSDSGIIRYQLGCKDVQQCPQQNGRRSILSKPLLSKIKTKNISEIIHLLDNFNQKRSQGLMVCSKCCTSTLCNSALCGHSGYSPNRGPVCFNCPLQNRPDDCDIITVCGLDQMCMLYQTSSTVSHQYLYQTKCEEVTRCVSTKHACDGFSLETSAELVDSMNGIEY